MIKPEELEDVDTEESSVLEHKDYAESIQAARDNIKIRKKPTVHGVEYVLLGNESQQNIHYAMPMRIMGYDYNTYKKQYDDNAKKYQTSEGIEEDEYLSRMKRTDKFVPVISIVIYYGEKPWDGPITLHGMLNIPDDLVPYVNDYKILLAEARKNSKQEIICTCSKRSAFDKLFFTYQAMISSISRNSLGLWQKNPPSRFC